MSYLVTNNLPWLYVYHVISMITFGAILNIVAVVDAQYMYMCVTTFDACHLARPVVTEMRG